MGAWVSVHSAWMSVRASARANERRDDQTQKDKDDDEDASASASASPLGHPPETLRRTNLLGAKQRHA